MPTASSSDTSPASRFRTTASRQPGDRCWTPTDWAWIGGLFDLLLPAWHHGVAGCRAPARKFDPGEALDLIARHGVRDVHQRCRSGARRRHRP